MKLQKLILGFCGVVMLLVGCDSQSPNAKYVDEDGVSISLVNLSGQPSQELDRWWIKKEGSEIYSAAFGYKCTIAVDGIKVGGIKVCCYITNHSDPVFTNYDIWDKIAPNGKPYGYVVSRPPGKWDCEKEMASVRTVGEGECSFFIGLGSPTLMGIFDTDFLWPGGEDIVSTLVEVKFVIPKYNNNIEKECYMYFFRASYMDFWEPYGGVIGNSHSALEEWEEGIYSMSGEGITIQLEQIDVPKKAVETASLPIKERTPPPTWELNLTSPISHFASTAEPNKLWEYLEGRWRQYKLVWDWYYECWDGYWTGVETIIPLWMTDPCDYQDGVDLVSYADTYTFTCVVLFEEIEDINVNSFVHTVILKSKDEEGNAVAWLPIDMQVYYIEEEEPYCVWLWTDWIVPLEHRAGQGYYIDYWGYFVATIYVPDNGYLEVEVDDFYGDFNFDGIVNFVDYSRLLKYMGKGLTDEGYNLMYDADRDGQTTNKDSAIFFQNWLKTRRTIEAHTNFVDFAKFANTWFNGDADFEDLNDFLLEWLVVCE